VSATSIIKFKALGRNCPVCAGTRTDCRESGSGLIHCRAGQDVPGWRFVGEDAIGFGMYSDAPQTSDPVALEQYRKSAADRKAAIALERLLNAERALSADERSSQFRLVARHSGLSTKHRAKLEKRGYTPEQIQRRYDEGRLWTWADDASIPGLSPNLPGATSEGTLHKFGGTAVAVTDPDGKVLGAQIRSDGDGGSGGSKYFWVSSATISGCSPALKNGENPIGFYRPDGGNFAPEINIGEGFLKSDLTAQKHGRIVIGAAGGNFAASPQQFGEYLAAAAQITKSKLVVLNADGGAIENPDVMRTYFATASLVESLGYEFRVRWYGQFNKAHGDSDEVDSATFDGAALLSWAEFKALAPNEQGKGFKPRAIAGGKASDEPELSTREWAIAKRQFDFNQVLPLLERNYKITHKGDAERDVAYYEGRTPEFSQALADNVPTIMVRGWLAAGKTYAAIESIKRLLETYGTDRQMMWVSGRNGLLRQTEKRLLKALEGLGFPIYHFQDDVSANRRRIESGERGLYGFTDASFSDYHIRNIGFARMTIFIDEFAGIRANIPGNTKVFPQFKKMLTEAAQVVMIDAFLGDVDCRILSKFRQGDRLILDQIPEKSPKHIQWAECRNANGEISMSHDGLAFTVLHKWLTAPSVVELDQRYIVVTDSLLSARVVQYYALKYCGLKPSDVLLCCSETPEENHRLLADPDGRIRESGAKLVILTPTAESGIDIQVPFTAGLGLFCGVLSGTGAMQMIGRARQCDDWIISAPRRSLEADAFISNAKLKRILERLPETLEIVGIKGDERSDSWAVWQREIRGVQAAFNSEFIHHLLEEHYESVETIELENPHCQTWKEAIKEVKTFAAENILKAPLKHGQEMKANERQPQLDWEVWALKLAEGHEQYPQIWELAIANYNSGNFDKREGAIAWARELLKEREMMSLKRYVQAADGNLDDDNALDERVTRLGSNYLSPAFKHLQHQTLFRALNLESLAKLDGKRKARETSPQRSENRKQRSENRQQRAENRKQRGLSRKGVGSQTKVMKQWRREQKAEDDSKKLADFNQAAADKKQLELPPLTPHENVFDARSPQIQALYKKFTATPRLVKLFPTVEDINDFWRVVKATMKYFGFKSQGETMADTTVSGKFANGKGRTRKHPKKYFVGWAVRAESGSNFFIDNFDLIIAAVRDRLEVERLKHKDKASSTSPPEEWAAAA
jgi:hypothetical protein